MMNDIFYGYVPEYKSKRQELLFKLDMLELWLWLQEQEDNKE